MYPPGQAGGHMRTPPTASVPDASRASTARPPPAPSASVATSAADREVVFNDSGSRRLPHGALPHAAAAAGSATRMKRRVGDTQLVVAGAAPTCTTKSAGNSVTGRLGPSNAGSVASDTKVTFWACAALRVSASGMAGDAAAVAATHSSTAPRHASGSSYRRVAVGGAPATSRRWPVTASTMAAAPATAPSSDTVTPVRRERRRPVGSSSMASCHCGGSGRSSSTSTGASGVADGGVVTHVSVADVTAAAGGTHDAASDTTNVGCRGLASDAPPVTVATAGVTRTPATGPPPSAAARVQATDTVAFHPRSVTVATPGGSAGASTMRRAAASDTTPLVDVAAASAAAASAAVRGGGRTASSADGHETAMRGSAATLYTCVSASSHGVATRRSV